jgi:hypothetical protein
MSDQLRQAVRQRTKFVGPTVLPDHLQTDLRASQLARIALDQDDNAAREIVAQYSGRPKLEAVAKSALGVAIPSFDINNPLKSPAQKLVHSVTDLFKDSAGNWDNLTPEQVEDIYFTGALTDPGAMSLFALLFLWQMPHFYALAWRHRDDYARAGYQMISRDDPMGARTASRTLAYTAALSALPVAASAAEVTGPMFAIEGSVLNAYMLYLAWRFYKNTSDDSAKRLFFATLWYLPVLMTLMAFHAAGWRGEDRTHSAHDLPPLEERFRLGVVDTRAWLRGNACVHEVVVDKERGKVAAGSITGEDTCAVLYAKRAAHDSAQALRAQRASPATGADPVQTSTAQNRS